MHLGTQTRRRTLSGPSGLLALLLLSALALGAGCKKNVLLLKVSAEYRVDTFDITVTTPGSHRDVLLKEVGEPVDSDDPTRDISEPGSELRLALKFPKSGRYLIHLVGYSSGPPQVFTQEVVVDGETHKDIFLIQLAGMDGDGDGFISQEACAQLDSPSINCDYADCQDASPLVNPLAQEICDDGIDNDCVDGDAPCVDNDGDGQPEGIDCNDNDPTIYRGAPEPPNGCNGGPAGLCGDGIDQDCDGQDTVCLVDDDCDGSPAVQDCDDHNPDIFPGQAEDCTNGIDDNCNGDIDEGCVNCDLDGDGYQRDDPANGCPDEDNPVGQAVDCDDFDSGVHPDITLANDGNEGGENATHAIYLLQLCDGIDNDCDGDVDEGCWPLSCDADQDGYQNASCNPGPGQEDCDDTDPTVYPGAPDICGDGLFQNCNTDTPCDSDGDGDGYNSSVDCDDNNPDVHPGATEICNGVDDDCDGIVDEGNPDPLGTKMVNVYCNDDNDGICGANPGPGRCVCTKVDPGTTRDEGNRVACSGEDLNAVASPRCLFAPIRESFEQCDPVDHDCDGENDDPTGATLLEFGWACGTDVGECVAGTVVGCDFTQTTVGALNEHFLCSPTFVGASPVELCNGRDDDCDGDIPNNETDGDFDGYMACSNCAGQNLASGIIGCDDCAPGAIDIHPGHADNCNTYDDDCDPSTPNGIDECGGAVPDCCGSYNLCTNLLSDFNHCGSCTHACDSYLDSICTNGGCRCGTGPTCNPGQECVGVGSAGTCQCNASSCPDGCCNNNNCVPFSSQDESRCGDNGVTCFSCINERVCTNGVCVCHGSVNPGPESICNDTLDNDCDGSTNCADSDCAGDICAPNGMRCSGSTCACSGNGSPPESAEATCDDGIDNDCDGAVDCIDTNCNGNPCGANGRVCSGSSCICAGNGGTPQGTESLCNDGHDNDCDGQTDCADGDCAGGSCGAYGQVCAGGSCLCPGGSSESTCDDSLDNDCDGDIDCADSDCAGDSCGTYGKVCSGGSCICPGGSSESSCVDGLDNDCDGNIDCDDSQCDGLSCGANGMICSAVLNSCVCGGNGGVSSDGTEMDCSDGHDNNCNGQTDCADPSCSGVGGC